MAAGWTAAAAGSGGLIEIEGVEGEDGATGPRLFSFMELKVMDPDQFQVRGIGGVVGKGLGENAVRLRWKCEGWRDRDVNLVCTM